MLKGNILIIVLFLLTSKFICNGQVFSERINLDSKEYEFKLNNGKQLLIKKDGNIVIDKQEYKYVDVRKDYFYETGFCILLNYSDFIYIDLRTQHGEYGAIFKILINLKNNKIIFKESFATEPILKMIGYKNYIIIIYLEKIEVFNLNIEKVQYEERLPYLVFKVNTIKDGVEIANFEKQRRVIKYDEIIKLKSLIKRYTPKIDNLRFRESPTIDGKFIRMLSKDEKLEIIEQGKSETINGVKGNWVKVKTEKGEIGWCFDAYLEEIKDDNVKKN